MNVLVYQYKDNNNNNENKKYVLNVENLVY